MVMTCMVIISAHCAVRAEDTTQDEMSRKGPELLPRRDILLLNALTSDSMVVRAAGLEGLLALVVVSMTKIQGSQRSRKPGIVLGYGF